MSPEELIFNQYRGKRLLLDANLLLLYLIGSFERSLILTFKRTAHFNLREFDLLVAIMSQFSAIITTPHILTEVGNLANSLPLSIRSKWLTAFAAQISAFDEIQVPATVLCEELAFNPFGLTDAALQNAASNTLVLSEDFRLTGSLAKWGVVTINFRSVTSMISR